MAAFRLFMNIALMPVIAICELASLHLKAWRMPLLLSGFQA